MKKALLFSASVAVLAMPTLASALEVTGPSGNIASTISNVDGVDSMGLGYADDVEESGSTAADTDMDLDWSIKGENCCFSYGGMIGLKGEGETVNDTVSTDVAVDDAHIYIQTSMGKFEVGVDEGATMGVFDRDYLAKGPLSGSTSVINADAGYEDTMDAGGLSGTRVTYEHTIAGFAVAAGYDENEEWAASLGYSADLSGIALSVAAGTTSADAMGLKASATMGDYTLVAGYAADDSDETSTYIGAATSFMGVGLSAEYIMNEAEDNAAGSAASANTFILGASYSLAPGLTVSGSVGTMSWEGDDAVTAADVAGVNYSSGDGMGAAARLKLAF